MLRSHLRSLNATFYPNVTKKRQEARNSMLGCLLLDLFVAMSVTQMPACFIFICSVAQNVSPGLIYSRGPDGGFPWGNFS